MDSTLKASLIAEAKQHLALTPRDPIHETSHHARVWNFAQQIASSLKDPIDMDLLEVICWWHDVQLTKTPEPHSEMTKRTAAYLAEKLPTDLRETATDAVINHEFGLSPHSLIGQILQDADKLDQTSLVRLEMGIKAIATGKLPREAALKSLIALRDGAQKIYDSYHFAWSREYHQQHMPAMLDQLASAISLVETSQTRIPHLSVSKQEVSILDFRL